MPQVTEEMLQGWEAQLRREQNYGGQGAVSGWATVVYWLISDLREARAAIEDLQGELSEMNPRP